jgi:hypothetical protein
MAEESELMRRMEIPDTRLEGYIGAMGSIMQLALFAGSTPAEIRARVLKLADGICGNFEAMMTDPVALLSAELTRREKEKKN